jgi:hypothetical protein
MRNQHRALLPGVLFLFAVQSFASGNNMVHIAGRDTSYHGVSLNMKILANPITSTTRIIASCTVQPDGSFAADFPLESTQPVYIEAGKYRFYFFAEPGVSYRLVLPAYLPKDIADDMNPYFQPVLLHIGAVENNGESLNRKIYGFDEQYRPLFDRMAFLVYGQYNTSGLDSLINKLENDYAGDKDPYLIEYMNYKMKYLTFLPMLQRGKDNGHSLFPDQATHFNNPAYLELFLVVFKDIFQKITCEEAKRETWLHAFRSMSYPELKGFVARELSFTNGNFLDMIVLKGLFETYYSNELPRPTVVQMLDQMILNAPSMEVHPLAVEVKERITALMEGSPAPDVKGFDLANKPVSLANFRGKYIYLDFFSVSNYACIKDFELLGYIQARFFDTLVVVSISMDPLPDDLDDYLSRKDIPWQVIRSVDVKEAAERFQLVALPAYFLIAPDGKFVMSPAPAPTDRFEEYFARYLERRKQF